MNNDDIVKLALKLLEKYYFEENNLNISFNEFVDKYLDDFMTAYIKLQKHFSDKIK